MQYYNIAVVGTMPRVTAKGQVTIPKEIREEIGIEPGDEIAFKETDTGYVIRKEAPTTANGEDPFEKHRDSANGTDTMPERMRRLRGEYPRAVEAKNGDDDPESET